MAGLVGGGTRAPVQYTSPIPTRDQGKGLVGGDPSPLAPSEDLFPPYEPIIINVKGDDGKPGKDGEPGEPGRDGDPGAKGEVGGTVFNYLMPVAQTTAVFEHNLGRDPIAVQVIVDGTVREEYSVSFPLPGVSVMVGFDVSVQALIRLI